MTAAHVRDAWLSAPAGLLRLDRDGTVLAVNRRLATWVGPADTVRGRHVTELLPVGARIYWETHLSPLLLVEGRVDEVALELRGPDGRLPVLLSAELSDTGIDVAVSSARERSRFEHELRTAQTAARIAERQVRALQQVTAALSEAVGVDAVSRALLDAVTGPLGAARGTLWLPATDGRLECHASTGPQDVRTDAVLVSGLPEAGAVEQPDGTVLLVLQGHRALRGVLALSPSTGPGADPVDLDVCTAVAQQAGLALDRAQTYAHTADVAMQLQRALLAGTPPEDDRYAVATVYRPGVEALEVGGDWYDVFLSGPGLLSVVIGDVVGRGLGAASAMGQLRSAVRAIAAPDVGPADLLHRLDRFAAGLPAAGMATVAYVELDLTTGGVRFACAGHPPPLLLPVDADPRLLWDGRSTPLGAFTAPAHRPEGGLRLSPGDRLLLCTDGLFERRGRDLGEGLDHLVQVAGGLGLAVGGADGPSTREPGAAPDDAAQEDGSLAALTRTMLADEQTRDDVCAVLLRWIGDSFEHHLPADLSGLSAARRSLDGWLADRRVAAPDRADLVLAASEALANAGQHGGRGHRDTQVRLRAWLRPVDGRGREAVLAVADPGTWRPATTGNAERGRGLHIIRALVDEVHICSDAGTTVRMQRRLDVGP